MDFYAEAMAGSVAVDGEVLVGDDFSGGGIEVLYFDPWLYHFDGGGLGL